MPDLRELLDAFDRLVALAAPIAPPEATERAARVGQMVRTRRGFPGDSLVVALAGGTGSGKSSLLNALAGREVAPTGPKRPTTDRPLAWMPREVEPELGRLLDHLGIGDRVCHEGSDPVVVIDLPDIDSVVAEHRSLVERLLPEIDGVIWVLDPDKYKDEAVRRGMRGRTASPCRFVLNQIDRVPVDQRPLLVEDLRASLRADGFTDPVIVPVAADPPSGVPEGIDEVARLLAEWVNTKRMVEAKLVADLMEAADALISEARLDGGTAFQDRWRTLLDEVSERLARDPGAVGSVSLEVIRFVETLAEEVDPVTRERLVATIDDVEGELDSYGEPPPREVSRVWWVTASATILAVASAALVEAWWAAVVLLIVGGAATWAAAHRARRRRAAIVEEVVAARREEIRHRIDRSLGRRLRLVLRERSGPMAAYTEFRILASRMDPDKVGRP